jgi:hypothetical protein
MTDVYNQDFKPITDPQEREAAFKPILEYVASLDNAESSSEISLKSIVTVMKSAKEQFSNLVRYHRMNVIQHPHLSVITGLCLS